MKKFIADMGLDLKRVSFGSIISLLVPALLFWVILAVKLPYSFTHFFHQYSFGLFFCVLLLYYLSFRLSGSYSQLAAFGLTMLLFALAVSYLWASGFSDNFIISGLLPYKDAKNYYLGANLILNGFPLRDAGQAVGRPLFPGFLSSLLLLTGQNLTLTLAIVVQLTGFGLYLSTRQIRSSVGAPGASLYITLLYFYILPMLGYNMSELLGFTLGCFAFAILWYVSHNPNWFDLLLGLTALMVAVSARAGAFFVFPMLALWAGFVLRGAKRFSMKWTAIVSVVVILAYFFVNTVYPRLFGVPEGSAFGNFAYTIYGQVRGGTGWHSAIAELHTREPSIVYKAAADYFLAHPFDFIKAAARSYRDFFFLGGRGIFIFASSARLHWLDMLMWTGSIILMILGLVRLIARIHINASLLLMAGFVGLLLSIPFLPPIDGGNRFYASTMPFCFILLAIGMNRSFGIGTQVADDNGSLFPVRSVSIILVVMTVLLPIALFRIQEKPDYDLPACASGQKPFVIRLNPGSHIDLIRDGKAHCGYIPDICYDDFWNHNTEKSIDDFYQQLNSLATASDTGLRITPTISLMDGHFQYFITSRNEIPEDSTGSLLSGCAVRIRTSNQSFYQIQSFTILDK